MAPITVDIMAFTPLSGKYRARQAATRRSLPSLRGACASHAAIKPVRFAAWLAGGLCERLAVTQSRDMSGLELGKLDAIPLRNYVYCAEQV
jgi:hypothetical protein